MERQDKSILNQFPIRDRMGGALESRDDEDGKNETPQYILFYIVL